MWRYTGNKLAEFHGNILSLSENIGKSFRGLLFWLRVYVCVCVCVRIDGTDGVRSRTDWTVVGNGTIWWNLGSVPPAVSACVCCKFLCWLYYYNHPCYHLQCVQGKNETKMFFFVISSTELGWCWWNLVYSFWNKFAAKPCKYFPPHLNNFSTLPCENLKCLSRTCYHWVVR